MYYVERWPFIAKGGITKFKKSAALKFLRSLLLLLISLSTFLSLRKCTPSSCFTCSTCSSISQNFRSGRSSGFTCNFFSHNFQNLLFNPNDTGGLIPVQSRFISSWLTILTTFNVFHHHAKSRWLPKSHNEGAIRSSTELLFLQSFYVHSIHS